MENSTAPIGSKGLIKKHEFVRLILQSLYTLGYRKSADKLELESGISSKSKEFGLLESYILTANWDACIDIICGLQRITDETRASACFLILKQWLLEFSIKRDYSSAISVLRKNISTLHVGKENVRSLAFEVLSGKDTQLGEINHDFILQLRKTLLNDMEKLLPPPITVPERRLEYLVEMAVTAQIDSCIYHNSPDPLSIYRDHKCGRDQIPTETNQILVGHKNEVWFVQFSNNGEYLASSSSDCTAIIWKVLEDGNLILKHTLRSHQKPVSFVAWSPNDSMLLTCGNMEVLKLWDVETGTCKHTFGNHEFTVSSCAWFPDSKRLVCGSSDEEKGIYMWDCEGNEIRSWKGTRMPKVLDLAVTPNGEYLISVFSGIEIRILNTKTNSERVISEERITSLSISADSRFFLVNLNSQEIHMWDVAGKWEKPVKYRGHKQQNYVIRSCFGGLNSSFIASGSEDSQVYIWNCKFPEPIEILSGHLATVNSVSWNPKRPRMLASGSDDQTIRIWGGPSSSSRSSA
ncbi:WD repeat-containing protein WDS homolog [Impatiens glandulifera]|uniref:WD repeat-containing protein WDS homolog n=1 Tax=Impatiens glandulifera TaxID=253017 RepID=UPI001FB12F44|nr:WD repeat-containing protein WDS homolog [Impatiens glandulifera]